MIKKLRRKFILISIFSIVLVIFSIVSIINIVNYNKMINDCDEMIKMIHNEKDMFKPENNIAPPNHDKFGRELKFQTRYFTITIDNNNNIVSTDFSHIAKVDGSKAEEYKNIALSSNGKYIDDYYCKIIDNEIIFLDCQRELQTFQSFLLISFLISSVGSVIIFILIIVLSKIAIKPFYKNEEKQKKFITDASHELKTPLTIINADVEILEMSQGEDEWKNSIKNQVSRLSKITSQLTSLAKLDEIKYELSNIDISKLLRDSIDDVSVLFSEDSIKFNIENDLYINGNIELIKELFSILLENAYKYSTNKTIITLSKHNKSCELKFSNTCNLDDGNYDYLFDRFYRLDESRNSKKGGSGLGLSIAKEIINVHNGKIKVYCKDNILTFEVCFKIV